MGSKSQGKGDNGRLSGSEPVLIIKPALKNLGLDYLHITLIALVVVLVALSFELSTFKPGLLMENCSYGTLANGTCMTPVHNESQAIAGAGRILAGYATLTQSSLSLLPFYSKMNEATASYLSQQKEWFVAVPYIDPLYNNKTFSLSLLIYDANLSLAKSFVESAVPSSTTNDTVVALGVVKIADKVACTTKPPYPLYAFIDPYAPGAIGGIYAALNQSLQRPGELNVSYKFITTGYETQYYAGYGLNETLGLNENLFCASMQPEKFGAYMHNLSILYTGAPISGSSLYSVAAGSGLNISGFDACMTNSSQVINHQNLLASFYSVSPPPSYVVNCEYDTIPQMLNRTVSYLTAG